MLHTQSPEFLKVNPNGLIPSIDDDGLVLHESLAINLYLARKHDRGLWPATVEGEGLAFQWSFFAVTEIDPDINTWAAGQNIKTSRAAA